MDKPLPYAGPILDGPYEPFDDRGVTVLRAPSPLVEVVLENVHFDLDMDEGVTAEWRVLPWGPIIDAAGEVRHSRARYRWDATRQGWVLQSHTRVVYTWSTERGDWEPQTLDIATPNPTRSTT